MVPEFVTEIYGEFMNSHVKCQVRTGGGGEGARGGGVVCILCCCGLAEGVNLLGVSHPAYLRGTILGQFPFDPKRC